MLVGGLVLMAKAVMEMHELVEGIIMRPSSHGKTASLEGASPSDADGFGVQFGQRDHRSWYGRRALGHGGRGTDFCGVLALAEGISTFVSKNPTVKTLALAFLLLIGVMLTAEGVHFHIEKGYIYFAMGFSIFVELINRQVRKRGRRMNPWRRPGPPPM